MNYENVFNKQCTIMKIKRHLLYTYRKFFSVYSQNVLDESVKCVGMNIEHSSNLIKSIFEFCLNVVAHDDVLYQWESL